MNEREKSVVLKKASEVFDFKMKQFKGALETFNEIFPRRYYSCPTIRFNDDVGKFNDLMDAVAKFADHLIHSRDGVDGREIDILGNRRKIVFDVEDLKSTIEEEAGDEAVRKANDYIEVIEDNLDEAVNAVAKYYSGFWRKGSELKGDMTKEDCMSKLADEFGDLKSSLRVIGLTIHFNKPESLEELSGMVRSLCDNVRSEYGLDVDFQDVDDAAEASYDIASDETLDDYEVVYDTFMKFFELVREYTENVQKSGAYVSDKQCALNIMKKAAKLNKYFSSLGLGTVLKSTQDIGDVESTIMNPANTMFLNIYGNDVRKEPLIKAVEKFDSELKFLKNDPDAANCKNLDVAFDEWFDLMVTYIKGIRSPRNPVSEADCLRTINENVAEWNKSFASIGLEEVPAVSKIHEDLEDTILNAQTQLYRFDEYIDDKALDRAVKDVLKAVEIQFKDNYEGVSAAFEKFCDLIVASIEKIKKSGAFLSEQECVGRINRKVAERLNKYSLSVGLDKSPEAVRKITDVEDAIINVMNAELIEKYSTIIEKQPLEDAAKTFHDELEVAVKHQTGNNFYNVNMAFLEWFILIGEDIELIKDKLKKADRYVQGSLEVLFEKQILPYFLEDGDEVNFKEVFTKFNSVRRVSPAWYGFMQTMCMNKIKSDWYNKKTLIALLLISCCASSRLQHAEAICRALRKITKSQALQNEEYIKETEKIRKNIKGKILLQSDMASLQAYAQTLNYTELVDKSLSGKMFDEAEKARAKNRF